MEENNGSQRYPIPSSIVVLYIWGEFLHKLQPYVRIRSGRAGQWGLMAGSRDQILSLGWLDWSLEVKVEHTYRTSALRNRCPKRTGGVAVSSIINQLLPVTRINPTGCLTDSLSPRSWNSCKILLGGEKSRLCEVKQVIQAHPRLRKRRTATTNNDGNDLGWDQRISYLIYIMKHNEAMSSQVTWWLLNSHGARRITSQGSVKLAQSSMGRFSTLDEDSIKPSEHVEELSPSLSSSQSSSAMAKTRRCIRITSHRFSRLIKQGQDY